MASFSIDVTKSLIFSLPPPRLPTLTVPFFSSQQAERLHLNHALLPDPPPQNLIEAFPRTSHAPRKVNDHDLIFGCEWAFFSSRFSLPLFLNSFLSLHGHAYGLAGLLPPQFLYKYLDHVGLLQVELVFQSPSPPSAPDSLVATHPLSTAQCF